MPRLKLYFDSVVAGKHVDMGAYNRNFKYLERSDVTPFENPLKAAIELVERYSAQSPYYEGEHYDVWNPQDFPSNGDVTIDYAIHSENINGLASIEFEATNGSVRIPRVEIRNRWTPIQVFHPDFTVKTGQKKTLKIGFPPVVEGTGKIVYVRITYSNADNACGIIRYKYF